MLPCLPKVPDWFNKKMNGEKLGSRRKGRSDGQRKKIGKATQASEKNREDNEGEIEGAAPGQPAREPPSRHGESSEIRTERKKER